MPRSGSVQKQFFSLKRGSTLLEMRPVEITVPKGTNVFAAEYKLYLPDKALLQNKLKEWIREVESVEAATNLLIGGKELADDATGAC